MLRNLHLLPLLSLTLSIPLTACAVDDKDDIGLAPFDLSAEGKDDSARLPSKGMDLRVGQLAEGVFTATQGFVRHDIQLDAGPADIDLVGHDNRTNGPLDTILYVFGPANAAGRYPANPVAFNDDMDPGVNLGSHIVFDVPTPGRYRVVVSTYDNWRRFPVHVSRGTYRLITKCQNPTWGACGPAISDVGGACWADDDCVSASGRPLHCEGEVTCAPGTQCLFVRQGVCAEDYAWMTYAARQCTNPWSDVVVSEDDGARFGDSQELAQVVGYAAAMGITLDEIGKLHKPNPMFQCLACGCARGDLIFIKVKTPEAATLAENGWIYSSVDPAAVSMAPRQCGSNPWETERAADVASELELVDTWMAGMGADVNLRGFTWSVEPIAVCAACSCPRGDRLVAFPVDAEDAGLLAGAGFNDVYTP